MKRFHFQPTELEQAYASEGFWPICHESKVMDIVGKTFHARRKVSKVKCCNRIGNSEYFRIEWVRLTADEYTSYLLAKFVLGRVPVPDVPSKDELLPDTKLSVEAKFPLAVPGWIILGVHKTKGMNHQNHHPYVHESRESAELEASRLSALHLEKYFCVVELLSCTISGTVHEPVVTKPTETKDNGNPYPDSPSNPSPDVSINASPVDPVFGTLDPSPLQMVSLNGSGKKGRTVQKADARVQPLSSYIGTRCYKVGGNGKPYVVSNTCIADNRNLHIREYDNPSVEECVVASSLIEDKSFNPLAHEQSK